MVLDSQFGADLIRVNMEVYEFLSSHIQRFQVECPIPGGFKAGLYGALANFIWWMAALPTAEGWNQVSLRPLPTQAIL